jgi:phosphoglycolate phosphatase-like HAD superfamily hydrolase
MGLSPAWYPRNRQALETFLAGSFSHDYAVFDFDNTISIGDSQWTLFIGQCERLAYALSPEEFSHLLRKEFTTEEIAAKVPSFSFSYQDLIEDIVHCYRQFYVSGEVGFKLKKAPSAHPVEQEEFLSKMLLLLFQVESFLSVDAACRFIQYPFVHLTSEEVYALAREVHGEAAIKTKQEGMKHATFISPKGLKSRAGVISVSLDQGFLVTPELSELLQNLAQKGIALYCISSSQEDTVKAALENPLFHLPRFAGIFTENLCLDKEGRYGEDYDFVNHPARFGEGKKEAILSRLLPLYGGKTPVMMAGDSDGDYPMLSSFPKSRLILIFNRGQRCAELRELKKKALQEEKTSRKAHYLVQGRNTPKAEIWPNEECLDSRYRLHDADGDFFERI